MKSNLSRRMAKPMLFLAAFIWGTSFFIMKKYPGLHPRVLAAHLPLWYRSHSAGSVLLEKVEHRV